MATAEVLLGENPLAGEGPDFILEPDQVQRGSQAVSSYLNSLKPGDGRRSAEDALQTLALLFSDGSCDAYEFPWQQVKSYHGAAAINILKEEGTPARLESLRFERDPTRKYRQVPPAYSVKHVQKLRNSLRRVLSECHKLGFLNDEQFDHAIQLPKADGKRPPAGRVLSDSEFRALTSACSLDGALSAHRDSLIMSLGFQGGLFVNEIVALGLKDLKYDGRRGQVTVYVKGAKDARGRTVPLQNGALIALEDWLAGRGDKDGPLICPIRKGGHKVEIRRMTATAIRQACLKRAEQSGVEPFSPNDLRRSVTVSRRNRGAAKKAVGTPGPVKPSALYTHVEEPEGDGIERVLFPYQTRKQELL
jgi:integrase/recombinase XerD